MGAGPTGLFLALALVRQGIDVLVLEQKSSRDLHSKSIGIHPPSLELLHRIGVGEQFMNRGVKIKQGIAFVYGRQRGGIDFSEALHALPYVIAIPQFLTEQILEDALVAEHPGIIRMGIGNVSFTEKKKKVEVSWTEDGTRREVEARYLIGCDGKNSQIRAQAGIPFKGGSYKDTYVMSDFPDQTEWRDTAVLFFHREGLVESFPLPGKMRRWVVKTPALNHIADAEYVARQVFMRTGQFCDPEQSPMTSPFGVQHYIAARFYSGRVILAGDAAHIVSPIGGQGMNLGWMDAWHLANLFGSERLSAFGSMEAGLERYNKLRRNRSLVAMHSAYFNMSMGRATAIPLLRDWTIRLLLQSPFRQELIRRFTMQGLVTE